MTPPVRPDPSAFDRSNGHHESHSRQPPPLRPRPSYQPMSLQALEGVRRLLFPASADEPPRGASQ